MPTIPPIYTDEYADLPSGRGTGYPHIVETEGLNEKIDEMLDLHAADGVATMLFKLNPDALSAFLDPQNTTFIYREEGIQYPAHEVVIFREGRVVTVSRYRNDIIRTRKPYSDISRIVGRLRPTQRMGSPRRIHHPGRRRVAPEGLLLHIRRGSGRRCELDERESGQHGRKRVRSSTPRWGPMERSSGRGQILLYRPVGRGGEEDIDQCTGHIGFEG